MDKVLLDKIRTTIKRLREIWLRTVDRNRFVAFSTGKDSLALAALLYEAVDPERPPCLYAHHNMEFSSNLEYLEKLAERGFATQTVAPFLEYFDLINRGIGFITLHDPWCVPMLVGTALLEWLQKHGAKSPRNGIMFRGMSGSEYSHKWHSELEIYERLNLPACNPLLGFSKNEIIEIIKIRYGLPLNPIYEHMDRTYCICCYTSDARRQAYSNKYHPEVCRQYYGQIEKMLFDSNLIKKSNLEDKYRERNEKINRHGFIYWRRLKAQNTVSAYKRRLQSGALSYRIRDTRWINLKHLVPVRGRWTQRGNEVRFWDVPEQIADTLIKKMINCLDCGFCVVECFPCRRFNRTSMTLAIDGCINCGKCLRLKFCMGWRHRFWRRIIVEEK